MKKLVDHLESLSQQPIIIRCNFDVPLDNSLVVDTTRIEDAVPTIKRLRQHGNPVILLAHAGRPDGEAKTEFSLRPIVPVLERLTGEQVEFIEYSPSVKDLSIPHHYPISLVENLRFWPGEEANDPEFALGLSGWGKAFVNEAFANCHREHASIVSLPRHLPAYAGLSLAEEIETIAKIRNHPDRPLVIVIGGAKLETKEPLITAFADKADHILVGGKIAHEAKNHGGLPPNVHIADLTEDGLDITSSAAENFAQLIHSAHTVIWNGTMGVFEEPEHQQGTRIIAEAVNATPAFTLVGGGDTETALTLLNLESGIDFISTGGGAMLTFLSTGELVGVNALNV